MAFHVDYGPRHAELQSTCWTESAQISVRRHFSYERHLLISRSLRNYATRELFTDMIPYFICAHLRMICIRIFLSCSLDTLLYETFDWTREIFLEEKFLKYLPDYEAMTTPILIEKSFVASSEAFF